jgi:WD40 repeat protein
MFLLFSASPPSPSFHLFIKIWDPKDGSFIRRLVGHTAEVTSLCYSLDELYLVSSGGDLSIIIWDMTTLEVARTLRGHSDVVNGYVNLDIYKIIIYIRIYVFMYV